MKTLSVYIFLAWVLTASPLWAQADLGAGTPVLFATADQARDALTRRDDFVRGMSPFDRAARMKTDRNVSEKEYLEFVGKNVLEWNEAEKQKMTVILRDVRDKLETWLLPFPKLILLAKTTGDEEGGAAYTRANIIVLPATELAAPQAKLQKTICHELFHILSRANPGLREKLYSAIGFEECGDVEFPAILRSRKITNPDAPANNHCLLVKIRGKDVWVIPILYSRAEKYDTIRGGEFFDYLQFEFLETERLGNAAEARPLYDGQTPKLVGLQQITGFFEQVGRNTDYVIHPEEILADNFSFLLLGETDVPSPEVIKKMEVVLKEKRATVPSGH